LDAIGGFAPALIDEMTEYKVRVALEKRGGTFLDWHKQEKNVEAFEKTPIAKRKIQLGDFVLMVFKKQTMDKSHDQQSGRMYIVRKILASKSPVRYELCDLKGTPVDNSFYESELTVSPERPDDSTYWLIKPQDTYKERTHKGKRQIYVQFLHYPANEGENAGQVKKRAPN
jgi:hypothetical protein